MIDQAMVVSGATCDSAPIQAIAAKLTASVFSSVCFELISSDISGDLYRYDVAAGAGEISSQLFFAAGSPTPTLTVTMQGRWALADVDLCVQVRALIIAAYAGGLRKLTWRSTPMSVAIARVTAGLVPAFAFERGFASVTRISLGVYELTLSSPVDFTANAAVFPSVINPAGAEVGVAIVSSTVFRVTTNNHLSGNPEDNDFYVKVETT